MASEVLGGVVGRLSLKIICDHLVDLMAVQSHFGEIKSHVVAQGGLCLAAIALVLGTEWRNLVRFQAEP